MLGAQYRKNAWRGTTLEVGGPRSVSCGGVGTTLEVERERAGGEFTKPAERITEYMRLINQMVLS